MVVMMMRNFKQRTARLESASGFGEVRFYLKNGSRSGIRRKEILHALGEAVSGIHSRRASVLLNAEHSISGGNLHHLAQAIAAGPVEPGTVNE
jgi:hypothetical protein